MQHRQADKARAAEMATALKESCLGVRVGRLSRLVGRRFDQALRPLGLSVAQMEILGVLTLNDGPQRPADLASWLAVERSTMSRNLAHMEQAGYVRTAETSPTGRSQRFAITRNGLRALALSQRAWQEAQASIAQDLGDGAVATLDGWLTALGPGRADDARG